MGLAVHSEVRVEGLGGIKFAIRSERRRHLVAVKRGLLKAARFLLLKSQEVVPVDTGYLKSTGYVKFIDDPVRPDVEVGYTAEYAIYVHEILENYHEPPTMAKFLERPYRENQKALMMIIREEVANR